jgi:hypothetical protein
MRINDEIPQSKDSAARVDMAPLLLTGVLNWQVRGRKLVSYFSIVTYYALRGNEIYGNYQVMRLFPGWKGAVLTAIRRRVVDILK